MNTSPIGGRQVIGSDPTHPADVTAKGVPVRVVAVKRPGHWIIRGIFCFLGTEDVRAKVAPFVAIAPADELEWTTHEYKLPGYLAYGSGDLKAMDWPTQGVFLFAHQSGDVYGKEARRLDGLIVPVPRPDTTRKNTT